MTRKLLGLLVVVLCAIFLAPALFVAPTMAAEGDGTLCITNSTSQAIPHNTSTGLSFDTIELNTLDSSITSVSGNSLPINISGVYLITFKVEWEAEGDGSRFINAAYPTSSVGLTDTRRAAQSVFDTHQNATTIGYLESGGNFVFTVSQNSGSSLDIGGGNNTQFCLHLLES